MRGRVIWGGSTRFEHQRGVLAKEKGALLVGMEKLLAVQWMLERVLMLLQWLLLSAISAVVGYRLALYG